jgi:hypothetical protein
MSEGHWVDNDARWFEQRMTYCALCGQVIPKRIWQAELADGRIESFCAPACAALYRSYLVETSR